jgi:hypothetical protein
MKAIYFAVGVLSSGMALLSLEGCAQESRPDVPSDAMQVASGGKVVAFTAPHDGKAYLRDDTNNKVVYSTDLKRDQVMRFDPALDTVRIDGNTAPEGIADPNHDHSIYFARSAPPDRADVGNGSAGDAQNVRVPVGIQVNVQTQPSAQTTPLATPN